MHENITIFTEYSNVLHSRLVFSVHCLMSSNFILLRNNGKLAKSNKNNENKKPTSLPVPLKVKEIENIYIKNQPKQG